MKQARRTASMNDRWRRRLRASKALGLKDVPGIVRDVDDERLEVALIENIQRRPELIETASACRKLMNEFNLSQEDGRPCRGNRVPRSRYLKAPESA